MQEKYMQLPKLIRTTAKYTVMINDKCKFINNTPITVRVIWHNNRSNDLIFTMNYEHIHLLENFKSLSYSQLDTYKYITVSLINPEFDSVSVSLSTYLAWKYSGSKLQYKQFKLDYSVAVNLDAEQKIRDLTEGSIRFVKSNDIIITDTYAVLRVYRSTVDAFINYKLSLSDIELVRNYFWRINVCTANTVSSKPQYSCMTRRTVDGKKTKEKCITTLLFGNESNLTRYEYTEIDGELWFNFYRDDTIIRKLYDSKVEKHILPMGISYHPKRLCKSENRWKNPYLCTTYINKTAGVKLKKVFSISIRRNYDDALKMAIAQRKAWEDEYGTTGD